MRHRQSSYAEDLRHVFQRLIDQERNSEGSSQAGAYIVNACHASLLLGDSIMYISVREGMARNIRHTGADVGSFAPALSSWIMGLLPLSTKVTIRSHTIEK